MTWHGDLLQAQAQDLSSTLHAHGIPHVFPGISDAFPQCQPLHFPGWVQLRKIAEVLHREKQLLNGRLEVEACNEHYVCTPASTAGRAVGRPAWFRRSASLRARSMQTSMLMYSNSATRPHRGMPTLSKYSLAFLRCLRWLSSWTT